MSGSNIKLPFFYRTGFIDPETGQKVPRVRSANTVIDKKTGQKTYLCKTCGRVDTKYINHHLHKKEHEEQTCNVCDLKFQGLKQLIRHR